MKSKSIFFIVAMFCLVIFCFCFYILFSNVNNTKNYKKVYGHVSSLNTQYNNTVIKYFNIVFDVEGESYYTTQRFIFDDVNIGDIITINVDEKNPNNVRDNFIIYISSFMCVISFFITMFSLFATSKKNVS